MGGKITIKVDTKNKRGDINRTIHVYSNDPLQPNSILKITGKIIEPVSINPKRLFLSSIEDVEVSGDITIINNKDSDILPEIVKNPLPQLIDLKLVTIDKGKKYILKVTSRAKNPVNTSISVGIKTNNKNLPLLRLKIRIYIKPVIKVSPENLNLGTIKINQDYRPQPRLVTILNDGKDPVLIKDMDFDNSVLNVGIEELIPGKRWRLAISPNIKDKKEIIIDQRIILKTNHKKYKKIIITVKGKISHSWKNTR